MAISCTIATIRDYLDSQEEVFFMQVFLKENLMRFPSFVDFNGEPRWALKYRFPGTSVFI